MLNHFVSLAMALAQCCRSRAALQLEILALRHQVGVLKRSVKRPRLTRADRILWVWLSRVWPDWRSALLIVKPETVIAWHRRGFRLFWGWKSRRRWGRPAVPQETRDLIREMSRANPRWGVPRIHGELLKLGIELSQATVAKYIVRVRRPPSQTWRAFLTNHAHDLVSVDFFTVPTAFFRVLYVFVVLSHDRRRVVHCNVTAHATSEWTAMQLLQAFPFDSAPRYLLRDRDKIYGNAFREQAARMGIQEVLTAPRSPWQSPFVERLIGSIRRECLDHVIVWNEAHLKRILLSYFDYYTNWRTHLGLEKDTPKPRAIQPACTGPVRVTPMVGGLHHRYERRAA